jgi:hypothetical protein
MPLSLGACPKNHSPTRLRADIRLHFPEEEWVFLTLTKSGIDAIRRCLVGVSFA